MTAAARAKRAKQSAKNERNSCLTGTQINQVHEAFQLWTEHHAHSPLALAAYGIKIAKCISDYENELREIEQRRATDVAGCKQIND